MTDAAVKEKLHDYIEHADNKRLQVFYSFVESEMEQKDNIFDDEMMRVLGERRANYLSGKSKASTLEESMKRLNNYRKAKKMGYNIEVTIEAETAFLKRFIP